MSFFLKLVKEGIIYRIMTYLELQEMFIKKRNKELNVAVFCYEQKGLID